jgi:dTDP-4-dehydrorhamnose reductase
VRYLVIGAGGQLGRALLATAPAEADVVAPARADCDLTHDDQIEYWLGEVRPRVVFNAAAYTAVDAAESDEANARLINATSAGRLGEAAKRHGARLVHVSTDFVFDGTTSKPYTPDDEPNPLNAYGRTKCDGEVAVLSSGADALIVRTAWVYFEHGRNFVHTMLRLMGERSEVRVVSDQIGTPTYARNLAHALWALAQKPVSGLYHVTDSGVASWYDFAVAIREEALASGLIGNPAPIVPISTAGYPTPARRPRFSVLDNSKTWSLLGTTGQHWRVALREMLMQVRSNG